MIVHVAQPSPLQVGHVARGTNSPRSVGSGTGPRRWEIISSNRGATLSYSFPSSARIGPRWNSTSSIAIFGTSAISVRRIAFTRAASGSSIRTRAEVSPPPKPVTSPSARRARGARGPAPPPVTSRDGAVDDERAGLRGREREPLHEREGLEPAREDGLPRSGERRGGE